MGIYGGKRPERKEEPEKEIRPFAELCRFADEYQYFIELDKPFKEFDNMFLVVKDKNDEIIEKIIIDDISALDPISAKILNKLSRNDN